MRENKKTKVGIVGLCGQSIFLRVDHFHQPEETIHATEIYEEVGGKGYNQAVAIKKLGGEPYFIGAVGKDLYGQSCYDYLVEQKISTKLIEKVGKTAKAFILRNKSGNNQVTVYPGVRLDENDLDFFFKEVYNYDFLLLNQEVPEEVLAKVVEWALINNKKIIFNPAPVTHFSQELIAKVWLMTPNWHEVREMFSLRSIKTITELITILPKLPVERLVVTLGKEGALVLENKKVQHLPALVVNAVDTTGAGDVFNAALAVALGEGMSLIVATKFSLIASGLSVTKEYVMNSIPNRQEVEKQL
ncbi:MAG TPA: PfkB family carbohydrate kinase [Bacilli bacterium]|nr:PfkB family carbohydrate kinase [Bacilli bacterium]